MPTRPVHLRSNPPGRMNKTEEAYAAHLDLLKAAGEIRWWGFEQVKIRLAKRTWYTPDFLVINGNNELELHEVKGFWQDDARVKIKVAAETYPFIAFVAVQKVAKKHGGGWKREDF